MVPIKEDTDYILIGSDGVFDKLDNNRVANLIHEEAAAYLKALNSQNNT